MEACQLSSILNRTKVDGILKAEKLLLKAKQYILLRFGSPDPIENFEIVCYNDSSLGHLKDGGSHGRFKIYLFGENNISSSKLWKSKKLHRVVKSTMAAEKLIEVEAAWACFWLANLLSKILYCKPNNDKNIKIECFTDIHQLYDFVYSIRSKQDKPLWTEIGLLREMTNKEDITKLNWTDNKYQIGDCLTKYGATSRKILNTLKTKSIKFT